MGTTACVFSSKYKKKWHESTVFLLEWIVFLTKYGYESSIFSWKIGKKGTLLTYLAHNIMYFWQSWHFFDQIWAWKQRVFQVQIEKEKNMNIWENRRMLTKYGYKNSVFFENVPTFSTKYWQNLRFFDHIWAWLEGVFHEIFKKFDMRVTCF